MGKTIFAIAELIRSALTKKGTYAYLAPEKQQAKKIAWSTLKQYVEKIPELRIHEAEIYVEFPNGSRIYIEGAEKPDRLRGMHLSGIVIDEVADMPYEMWELVIFPALQANKGWAFFIGTPKGKNLLYEFYMRGQNGGSSWGSCVIDVYKSGVYDEQEIEEFRETVGPAAFEQEYMCSFEAEVSGTYYAEILNQLERAGHIGNFPVDIVSPVYTAWDLGINDSTVVWFFQLDARAGSIKLVDYLEDKQKPLPYYIQAVTNKPYIYAKAFLPHDADRRNFETGQSRLDIFKKHGIKFDVLPKPMDTSSLASDIATVQHSLHKCYFDRIPCQKGINHLMQYSSKRDKVTGNWLATPKHDMHSDAADAFRYLIAGALHELKREETRQSALTNSQTQVKYSPLSWHKQLLKKGRRQINNLRNF